MSCLCSSQFTNDGGSFFAGVSFALAALPTMREQFIQTGQATLSIPIPNAQLRQDGSIEPYTPPVATKVA